MDDNKYKPPQEAERYSPEEMMARLKSGERRKQQQHPEDKGELVTREDGTQVVKVRRRKRRSKQSQKSKQKKTNTKLKWAILGSIALFILTAIIGTVFIITKYNGASFKSETEANISNLSGADVAELHQMRVTPVSAKARKVALAWNERSFLKSAVFHHLDADILATSFLGNEWIGEEVVSPQGEVYLQTPTQSAEQSREPMVSPYRFTTYRCNQLDLYFGTEKSAPSIIGLQASLWGLAEGKTMLSFNNGRMNLKGWPELEISSGVATLNRSDTEIEALLEAGNAHKGEITIKGRITKDTSKPVVSGCEGQKLSHSGTPRQGTRQDHPRGNHQRDGLPAI